MLSDKIWITRKTRIFTEDRLLKYSTMSQLLMTLYSLALVSLSIWNLQNNDARLNLVSAFASIAVLVLSVHVTSQKYAERSIAMRNCYIKLDELYSKVKRSETSGDLEMLQILEAEYAGLLINIENHSEYDFLCLRYSLKNNTSTTLPPFTQSDLMLYIWGKLWQGTLTVIGFVIPLPFIVLIWFW